MKKARVIAVCTVGLVLALLLGGLPSIDQIHSAVGTNTGVVYAAQSETALSCHILTEGEIHCKPIFKCTVKSNGEWQCEIGIECEIIIRF